MPIEALTRIRSQYPQYRDIPDRELAQRILDKYPQYRDLLGDIVATPAGPPTLEWRQETGQLPVAVAPFQEKALGGWSGTAGRIGSGVGKVAMDMTGGSLLQKMVEGGMSPEQGAQADPAEALGAASLFAGGAARQALGLSGLGRRPRAVPQAAAPPPTPEGWIGQGVKSAPPPAPAMRQPSPFTDPKQSEWSFVNQPARDVVPPPSLRINDPDPSQMGWSLEHQGPLTVYEPLPAARPAFPPRQAPFQQKSHVESQPQAMRPPRGIAGQRMMDVEPGAPPYIEQSPLAMRDPGYRPPPRQLEWEIVEPPPSGPSFFGKGKPMAEAPTGPKVAPQAAGGTAPPPSVAAGTAETPSRARGLAAPPSPAEAAQPLQTPWYRRPGKAAATLPGTLQQLARDLMPQQFSILTASREPAARQLGATIRREWLSGQGLADHELAAIRADVRPHLVTRGDNDMLARVLENPATPVPPNVQQAANAMRGKFEQYREALGLSPQNAISHYYPHLWEPGELRQALQAAAQNATTQGNAAVAQRLTERAAEVAAGRMSSFAQLPREVQNQFLMHRTWQPGASTDALQTIEFYVDRMARKIHGDRMLQAFTELSPRIADEGLVQKARQFIDRYTSRSPFAEAPGLGVADQAVRRAMYFDKLGLNPKWQFLTNVPGGSIMGAAEVGPVNMVTGFRMLRTPEGAAAFQRSGHSSLSLARDLAENPTAVESAAMRAFTMFASTSERGLRGASWLGTIAREMRRRGLSFDQTRDALAAGQVPREVLFAADEAVARSQGLYGLDNPAVFERPGMKAIAQFGAIPAKQLQTFLGWLRSPKTAKKALMYVVASEAYQEALQATTGVDVSRAFGVGIDFPRVIDAYTEWSAGKPGSHEKLVRAFTDPWTEGRSGVFSIAMGGPITTLPETVGRAGKAAVEVAAGIPGATDRALERAGGISGLVSRGVRTGRTAARGGDPLEVGREAFNVEGPKSAVRAYAFQQAQGGHPANGVSAVNEWNRRYPNDPIRLDPQEWGQAIQAGERLQGERSQHRATRPDDLKWRDKLPVRARSGF